MKTRVIVTGPTGRESALDVSSSSVTIGRGSDDYQPDVALDDSSGYVSRHHCALEQELGSWWVEDASRNGTHLRRGGTELRLLERTRLEPDDVILIAAGSNDAGVAMWWEVRLLDPNATVTIEAHGGSSDSASHEPYVSWNSLTYQLEVVSGGGRATVELRKQGYQLIDYMVSRNDGGDPVVCTTEELMTAIWGEPESWDKYRPPTAENLRDLVSSVRKAIEPDATAPSILVTQRGVGYRLATQT